MGTETPCAASGERCTHTDKSPHTHARTNYSAYHTGTHTLHRCTKLRNTTQTWHSCLETLWGQKPPALQVVRDSHTDKSPHTQTTLPTIPGLAALNYATQRKRGTTRLTRVHVCANCARACVLTASSRAGATASWRSARDSAQPRFTA